MEKQNRRTFVATAAAMGATAAASAMPSMDSKDKKQLVHHVYFWLKNRDSKEDLNKLIEGLNSLKSIGQLKLAKIGVPASTEKRDVVDNSYSVSWLNFFDDVQGQNEYQVHPIHLKFVEEYKHLWEKVVVYDSIDI
ncbi:MAG TPA: Dabb family protein [Chryseosolibacter sp.]|nr:Dabb family protein [Chryseosolibacter sp.]